MEIINKKNSICEYKASEGKCFINKNYEKLKKVTIINKFITNNEAIFETKFKEVDIEYAKQLKQEIDELNNSQNNKE